MIRTIMTAAAISLLSGAAFAADVQYDIRVDGITCPFCVATSEKALKKIDGVKHVAADLDAGVISVCAEEKVELTDAQLTKLFRDKGFTYRSMTRQDTCTIDA